MANIKSAKKRAVQSESRRLHNIGMRSAFRNCIKRIETLISARDGQAANQLFQQTVCKLDSFVNKGVAHSNKVARCKSRLNAKIKALLVK